LRSQLNQLIDEAAQRRPEGLAIRCRGESLTYGQLSARVKGLAHVLRENGVRRGDRVAVLLPKGLQVPVSFYGVLAAGAVLVPIDPKSPRDQVVRILQATGVSHLVCDPGRQALVAQVVEDCPKVARVVGLEAGATPVESTPWSAVDDSTGDSHTTVDRVEGDPAYILHTSGTSGAPKLILHTHRSAMSFVDWAVREYSIGPEDRLSNHSSHHTCFATFDFYAAARAGAATVLVTPAEAMMSYSLSALIEDERVSIWYSVPTALVHLSLRGSLEDRDLGALRWVLFAGEPFPQKHLRRLVEQIPTARFSHVYGSTEVNVCTFYHLPRAGETEDPLPIGRACPTAEVLVVDDELREVADGEAGELLVRASTAMSGYWGGPEANDQAFVRPEAGAGRRYFRTGDRVRLREDGNLVFEARTDLQVKVRGHRVELEGVEAALLSLGLVEEAAAVAVEGAGGDGVLRAAVVMGADGAEPADLRAGLTRILPPQSVPSEISVVDALPRTPTGKVDREALRISLTQQGSADGA
jgi:amino acid adenylation domain-containing protein